MAMKANLEQEILYGVQSPKSAKKLALSILMLKENIDLQSISQVVGVKQRQLLNYRKIYETQGLAALEKNSRYRPSSDLDAYKELIREDLLKRPAATASEASERIQKLTGLKRCPTQIRQFMRRLGLKPIKVAAIPAKANQVAQAEFLNNNLEARIKEAQKGESVLLFVDAAHFIWQLYLGVLWCMSRIFIPAASGRTRINVLGAYDPINNVLTKIVNRSYINSSINSSTVIELLERVRSVYPGRVITMVLDNAKYQRCKVVMEKATELHIELLFLPTYSPNLNLIERLWRFVRKECLYSRYYETSREFESATANCLDDINIGKKPQLRKLMSLKFQLFPVPTERSANSQKSAA